MAYIGREPLGGEVILLNSIESQFNGVLTTFNLTRTVSGVTSAFYPVGSEQLLVSLGGVIQRPDTTGDIGFRIAFNTIIFAVAPTAGTSCFIVAYGNVTDIGAPANNTVSTDKLVNGAVTPAKLSTGGPWWLSNGNVGIGTTNPLSKFHIQSGKFLLVESGTPTGTYNSGINLHTSSGSQGIQITSGSNYSYFTADETNLYLASNNGTTGIKISVSRTAPDNSLSINSSGNVGIGITVPQNVLDLGSATNNRGISWGGTGANYANIWTEYSTASIHIGQGVRPTGTSTGWVSSTGISSVGRSVIKLNFNTGDIGFHTTTPVTVADGSAVTVDQRMVIAGTGNVGIGTTNPDTKLDVRGSIVAAGRGLNVPHVVVKSTNGGIRYFEYYFNAVKPADQGSTGTINIISVANLSDFHQAAFTVEYGTRLQGIGTDATTSTCLKQFGINRFNNGNVAITDTNDIASDTNSNAHANVTCVTNGASGYIIRVEFSASIAGSSFCSGVIRGWGLNDTIPNITFSSGA